MTSKDSTIAEPHGSFDSHGFGDSGPPPPYSVDDSSNGEQSGDLGFGPAPPTSNKLSLATGVIKTVLNSLFTITVFLPMMLVIPLAGGKTKTKKLNK